MDSSVVAEQRLVGALTGRDRVVLDLLHLGNRELESLVLGGLERVATLPALPYPSSARPACSSPPSSSWLWEALFAASSCPRSPSREVSASVPAPRGIFPRLLLPSLIGGLARGGASGQRHHHRQCRQYQHQISQTHLITSRCLHQTPYSESIQIQDNKAVTVRPNTPLQASPQEISQSRPRCRTPGSLCQTIILRFVTPSVKARIQCHENADSCPSCRYQP